MRYTRNPLGAIIGLAIHFAMFLAGSVFFFTLNQQSDPGTDWWYRPVIGWGMGVAFHALGTVGQIAKLATRGLATWGPFGAIGGLLTEVVRAGRPTRTSA